jgi:hypothetical protein
MRCLTSPLIGTSRFTTPKSKNTAIGPRPGSREIKLTAFVPHAPARITAAYRLGDSLPKRRLVRRRPWRGWPAACPGSSLPGRAESTRECGSLWTMPIRAAPAFRLAAPLVHTRRWFGTKRKGGNAETSCPTQLAPGQSRNRIDRE